jgi:hypothetical protein
VNMYSSTLSLISELDRDGCSTPHPAVLTPEKETRYPLCIILGAAQGPDGCQHQDSIPRPCGSSSTHLSQQKMERGSHLPLYQLNARLIGRLGDGMNAVETKRRPFP